MGPARSAQARMYATRVHSTSLAPSLTPFPPSEVTVVPELCFGDGRHSATAALTALAPSTTVGRRLRADRLGEARIVRLDERLDRAEDHRAGALRIGLGHSVLRVLVGLKLRWNRNQREAEGGGGQATSREGWIMASSLR